MMPKSARALVLEEKFVMTGEEGEGGGEGVGGTEEESEKSEEVSEEVSEE